MRMLLTAFEPFDGTEWNSSLEGCRRFLDCWCGSLNVEFAVLPVAYDQDTPVVQAALRDMPASAPPDLILHTGQAGGDRVRVELLAVNARYSYTPEPWGWGHRLIDPSCPAAISTTLPTDRIARSICAEGIPAEVSHHAGIYLCNHVFYRSLRRREVEAHPAHVGFLHMPRLREQCGDGEPWMERNSIARAIRAAICSVDSTV